MKRLIFVLFCSVLTAFSAFSQGIEFFHGSLEEGLAKAKAEEKLVFMDCFTTWCGPCKRLAAQVFPDPEVGSFFNENFICLKKDMEKEDGPALASRFSITSYPTLLFIGTDGNILQKKVGALSAESLIEAGRKVLGKAEQTSDWAKLYEAGDRQPETIQGYVRVLNRAGKPSLKIVNDYLKTQKDLTTEFNLRFILDGTSECDSRVFDLLLEHREKIGLLEKPAIVDSKIEKACSNTLKKAVEFRSLDLLKEAKTKHQKALPANAEKWNRQADLQFFAATKDVDGYLEACKDCQKAEAKNDASKLFELVKSLMQYFPDAPKALKQAEKWGKTAAENGGLPEYWLYYAEILKKNGKRKEARSAAEKAKSSAGDKNPTMNQQADYFIQQLDEESKS